MEIAVKSTNKRILARLTATNREIDTILFFHKFPTPHGWLDPNGTHFVIHLKLCRRERPALQRIVGNAPDGSRRFRYKVSTIWLEPIVELEMRPDWWLDGCEMTSRQATHTLLTADTNE